MFGFQVVNCRVREQATNRRWDRVRLTTLVLLTDDSQKWGYNVGIRNTAHTLGAFFQSVPNLSDLSRAGAIPTVVAKKGGIFLTLLQGK